MLTNSGEAVSSDMRMMQEAIRSVGISLLGGKANIQGHFELGIDCIGATNEVCTLHSSGLLPNLSTL
jgi:NADH dehydrogenase [ubiquinone] 1 alpha subcomplex assembly factor 1